MTDTQRDVAEGELRMALNQLADAETLLDELDNTTKGSARHGMQQTVLSAIRAAAAKVDRAAALLREPPASEEPLPVEETILTGRVVDEDVSPPPWNSEGPTTELRERLEDAVKELQDEVECSAGLSDMKVELSQESAAVILATLLRQDGHPFIATSDDTVCARCGLSPDEHSRQDGEQVEEGQRTWIQPPGREGMMSDPGPTEKHYKRQDGEREALERERKHIARRAFGCGHRARGGDAPYQTFAEWWDQYGAGDWHAAPPVETERGPDVLLQAAETWERLGLPQWAVKGHDNGRFRDYTVSEALRAAAGRLAAPPAPEALEKDAWRLVLRDTKHQTFALTNGRAQLSVWTGEVDDPDLEQLRKQLNRGAREEYSIDVSLTVDPVELQNWIRVMKDKHKDQIKQVHEDTENGQD